MATDTIMAPVHPGEILTEFLEPLELSQHQLARSIAVPARRISEIVHGQRRISASTALRLARFFGTSERFWMNLQSRSAAARACRGAIRPPDLGFHGAGDENRTRTVSLGS
jgi:addiction module HigA family antidote